MRKLSYKDVWRKIEKSTFYLTKVKTPHFSPTISPAPKDVDLNEIESIFQGISYYFNIGVKRMILQKKYMGSYCDIELHKDISKSRFFSRSGKLIDYINRGDLLKGVAELHKKIFLNSDLSYVLIAAELMPWPVMGRGLIDRDFEAYYALYKSHINDIETTGIYDKVAAIKETSGFQQFLEDWEVLGEAECKKKWPQHTVRHYKCIMDFNVLDLNEYKAGLETYRDRLDLYGKDGEPYFQPFSVLKYGYVDGTEIIEDSNIRSFKFVNTDENAYVVLDFEAESFDENISKAYSFFAKCTSEDEEGVMIKPDQVFIEGSPPAFKVRNNEYLTLIYGINFKKDYDYYLKNRNIYKKQIESSKQWHISQELLKIPLQTISQENENYCKLVALRLESEHRCVNLDSRL